MIDLYKKIKNKKVIILDIDDTLVNYSVCHLKALNFIFNKYNITEDEYNNARELVKNDLLTSSLKHKKDLYFKKLFEIKGIYDYKIIYNIYNDYKFEFLKNLKFDADLIDLINNKKDKKICLATNYQFLTQVEKIWSIIDKIDYIITSEEINVEKPNFLYIYKIKERFNCSNNDIIIIGDSQNDNLKGIDYYPYNCNKQFFSICGKSGSGKSTLSYIISEINNSIIIEGDNYHKYERNSLVWKTSTHYNPINNNLDYMFNDIENLFYGNSIYIQKYQHDSGIFSPKYKLNYNNESIILEGLHTLYNNNYFKYRIFIDNKLADKLKIKRDIAVRNKTKEEVLKSINSRKDDYVKFIQPQKNKANIIINIFGKNENSFNLKVIFKDDFNKKFIDILKKNDNFKTEIIYYNNKILLKDVNFIKYRDFMYKLFTLLYLNEKV